MTTKQTAKLFANDARHTEALGKHGQSLAGLQRQGDIIRGRIKPLEANQLKTRDIIHAILLNLAIFYGILITGYLVS